jgi:hypothetical protein
LEKRRVNVDSVLISDYATVTAGKLTVVGCFTRIPADSPPVRLVHLSLSVVIHAHASEAGSTHTIEVRLLNARRELVRQPYKEEFTLASEGILPGIPIRHINVTTLLAPLFTEFGPYAFEVYIDGTYHAAAAFYVGGDPPPFPE